MMNTFTWSLYLSHSNGSGILVTSDLFNDDLQIVARFPCSSIHAKFVKETGMLSVTHHRAHSCNIHARNEKLPKLFSFCDDSRPGYHIDDRLYES